MLDFGVLPDKSVTIRFRCSPQYETRCSIDLAEFPSAAGVYVIRLANGMVRRLRGESPILKIGDTAIGFCKRFVDYNRKSNATDTRHTLYAIMDMQEMGQTDAYVMAVLSRLAEPIAVDFYYNATEKKFLARYLGEHWEVPPLNLAFRK